MQMLGDGKEIIGMDGIRYVGELLFGRNGFLFNVVSVDPNPPDGGPQDTGNRSERGGFAGAVRPNQADDLSWFNREAEIADGDEIVIAFAETLHCDYGEIILIHGQRRGCDRILAQRFRPITERLRSIGPEI